MREESLSSVGAQDMDTRGYQVSDLGDVEFYWENAQLHVDAVFIPGIDNPFSPAAFDDLKMGSLAQNHILLEDENDKENFSPTTPVSKKTTPPPAFLRSRQFGTRLKNVSNYVYIKLFK